MASSEPPGVQSVAGLTGPVIGSTALAANLPPGPTGATGAAGPPVVQSILTMLGGWNASTNTPTLTSSTGTANTAYFVTTAGTTSLNGIATWTVNDVTAFVNGVWIRLTGYAAAAAVASLSVTTALSVGASSMQVNVDGTTTFEDIYGTVSGQINTDGSWTFGYLNPLSLAIAAPSGAPPPLSASAFGISIQGVQVLYSSTGTITWEGANGLVFAELGQGFMSVGAFNSATAIANLSINASSQLVATLVNGTSSVVGTVGGSGDGANSYGSVTISTRNNYNLSLAQRVQNADVNFIAGLTFANCLLLGYGQSLSVGTYGLPVISTTATFPNNFMQGSGIIPAFGSATSTTVSVTGISGTYSVGETVTQASSGASGNLTNVYKTTVLATGSVVGLYIVGETVTQSGSGATATVLGFFGGNLTVTPATGTLTGSGTVTGATSGVTGTATAVSTPTVLEIGSVAGAFASTGSITGGTSGATSTAAFADVVLTGLASYTPNGGTAFAPLVANAIGSGLLGYGECIGVGQATGLRYLWNDQQKPLGGNDTARSFYTMEVGIGSRTIEHLSKGYYKASLSAPVGGTDVAPELYSRVTGFLSAMASGLGTTSTGVAAISYQQGEQDSGTAEASYLPNPTQYQARLLRLGYDMFNDTSAALPNQGRPPGFFFYQNRPQSSCDNNGGGPPKAQLETGKNNVLSGNASIVPLIGTPRIPFWCVGTPAPYPGKGTLHRTANGYRWMSAMFAKVMHKVVIQRQDWMPAHIIQATSRGTSLLVDLYLPVPPVVFDACWDSTIDGSGNLVTLAQVQWPDKGFTIVDSIGQATLTNPTIVSDTQLQFSISRGLVQGNNPVLYYADYTYHSGLGCVRDSDPTVIPDMTYVYNPVSGQSSLENISDEYGPLNGRPYPLPNWLLADQQPITVQA
jgi:hypothetical protein